jgi:selenocysteine lyase/cysteine desulfurase
LLDDALTALGGGPILVAVTGASNVTGELWPVAAIADVCKLHGARLAVDCAQLAPHAPIEMATWGVDYIAISGHKLYAPYGSGALIGRRDWLETGEPFIRGGGAVTFVTLDDVLWAPVPDRQEAGSPTVVGAVAMGVACRTLREYGMERVAQEEAELERYAAVRLAAIPEVTRYQLWDEQHPRIGVLTFNVNKMHYSLVAAALSAEHGVAVRDGCFCAHPLMLRLLGVDECAAMEIRGELAEGHHIHVPGAVRMSTGLTTTTDDLDIALAALAEVASLGPRAKYTYSDADGHYVPTPDDRIWPPLAALGASHERAPRRAALA